jgi:hypothetical protein
VRQAFESLAGVERLELPTPVLEIPIGRFVLCRVISLSTAQFSIFAGVSRDGRGRVVSAIRRCAQ